MGTTTDLIQRLEEAQRRVEAAKRRWLWALPHQANQAYLRYLAEEEYLGRLLDAVLTGAKAQDDQRYLRDENAAPAGC